MRRYQENKIERTRGALRRLWSTVVAVFGFIFGLTLARITFWPPQVCSGDVVEATGIFKFIAVVMVLFLAYVIWLYVIEPFKIIFRNFEQRLDRQNALRKVFRHALICAAIISVPMAFAISFELPQPFSIVSLLGIWITFEILSRYRGPTISASVSPLLQDD